MKYKIIPNFSFSGLQRTRDNFPQQFLDRHTITGSQLIASVTAAYQLIAENAYNQCDLLELGWRKKNRLLLQDNAGNNLDSNLDFTTDYYYFYLDGTTIPSGINIHVLGTYDIHPDTQLGTNVTIVDTTLRNQDYFETLINNTVINVEDPTCSVVTLTINVNRTFGSEIPIIVTNNGGTCAPTTIGATTYEYTVLSSTDFTIVPNPILPIIDDYYHTGNISTDTTVDFGIITKIEVSEFPGSGVDEYDCKYKIAVVAEVDFGNPIAIGYFNTTQTNGTYPAASDVEIYPNDVMYTYTKTTGVPSFDITFNSLVAISTYINLLNNTYSYGGTLGTDNTLFIENYTNLTP
jgi:hypothetical protein